MPKILGLLVFALGLSTPVYLPEINQAAVMIAVVAALATLAVAKLRIVAWWFCGFVLASWRLASIIDQQIPDTLAGVDLQLTVRISGIPVRDAESLNFQANITHAVVADGRLDLAVEAARLNTRKVKLSWRDPQREVALAPGQQWHLLVRLKRPRGFVNAKGFDYQAWLLAQGFSATGYVKASRQNLPGKLTPQRTVDALRLDLERHLFGAAPLRHAALFKALSLGLKSDISQQQWQVLNATGTTHLMAISGLHVGLFALAGFFLIRLALSCMPVASVFMLRALPASMSTILALVYAALAGFALPTQRALTMIIFFNVAYVLGQRVNPLQVLLLAYVCIVMQHPLALLSNGFWLSFAAVFVLLSCFALRAYATSFWRGMLYAQAYLFVGLFFLLLVLQLPVSFAAPLANSLAVPVVSFVLIPLLFVALLLGGSASGVGMFLLQLCDGCMSWLWSWLTLWSHPGDREWLWYGEVSAPGFACGLSAALLILLPPQLRLRWVGVALLVLGLGWQGPGKNATHVTILDVGQGLAVVARRGKEAFVYDAGARFSARFDIGSGVITPFLRAHGISVVPLVVISHGDNDHAGGLEGLLRDTVVGQVAANHLSNTGDAKTCIRGQHWSLAAGDLQVLWPEASALSQLSSNNSSCVVLLRNGDVTVLMTGDISREVESKLLQLGELPANIDVLIAPHHGSNTSSSAAFLAHLNPEHVIFSSGYRNHYGHPADKVIARYRQLGSQLWHTGTQGGISVSFTERSVTQIQAQRIARPRPWFTGGHSEASAHVGSFTAGSRVP